MTIDEFLTFDANILARLSDADLRAIASGGRKIANQRITRLKAAGIDSTPALESLPAAVRNAGFKTGDLSRAEIMTTIKLEQQFIRAKSSTISGWQAVQRAAVRKTQDIVQGPLRPGKKRFGYDEAGRLIVLQRGQKSELTAKQVNRFWELFHKVREDAGRSGSAGSPEIFKVLYNLIKLHPNMSVENLEKELPEKLDEDYIRRQEEQIAARKNIKRMRGVTF